METWIRLEIAFRIHWRRSRTPETQVLGRTNVEIRILGVKPDFAGFFPYIYILLNGVGGMGEPY